MAGALGPGEEGIARLALLLRPLPSPDAVRYRQEVFRDLEEPGVGSALRALGASVAEIRSTVGRAGRMRHPAERNRWILDALDEHDRSVSALDEALRAGPISSRGLTAARDRVASLVASPGFARRRAAVVAARGALDGVAFRLRLGQQRVVVSRARPEPDLAQEIRATFARLSDGPSQPVRVDAFDTLDMNPLEAEILARVVRLAPEPFALLAATVAEQQPVIDPWIGGLAAEAAWYLAVLDLLAPVRDAGLACGYPAIADDGSLVVAGVFDLALARRLVAAGQPIATSDIALAPGERLAVVTGPSQGGRTSIARGLGQLHVLAAAGCPVPAASALVPLVDAVHTVFDRPERLDDPGGRLRGELRQVRALLDATTDTSLVVANEPFASTTADGALALARRLLRAVVERGARVVVVTFLEELADDPGAVSLAAVADVAQPTARTFRFERRPADGLAHAQALAASHGLGSATVRARLAR
ncbi:MAG: MutS-related protein [Candidatus Limnocylindrales bacterium]